MYNYPIFEAPFMPSYALGCMGVSLLCTSLSAVYTCANELLEYPAKLIRPKPPKNGKRILLEKITPIWKHFSFSSKVTFRNLFRYKSRFFMTVISIGGCTALMLTAFGLKEAIACIAEKQYDDIFLYDAIAVIGSDVPEDDLAHIEDVINGESAIISHMSAVQETHDVYSESGNMEGYILALDDVADMDDYVQLQNRKSGEHLYIEDGKVIITEKMARVLGVKEGDFVTIDGASRPRRGIGHCGKLHLPLCLYDKGHLHLSLRRDRRQPYPDKHRGNSRKIRKRQNNLRAYFLRRNNLIVLYV